MTEGIAEVLGSDVISMQNLDKFNNDTPQWLEFSLMKVNAVLFPLHNKAIAYCNPTQILEFVID